MKSNKNLEVATHTNRKEKGITLIALIITIIILLILAGVAIGQLTGNGLFDKVKLAKEKSEEAQEKENETLGDYENEIDKYLSNSRVDSDNTQLKKLGTLTGLGSESSNYLELKECNEIMVTFKIGTVTNVLSIPYQQLTDAVSTYIDGYPTVPGASSRLT